MTRSPFTDSLVLLWGLDVQNLSFPWVRTAQPIKLESYSFRIFASNVGILKNGPSFSILSDFKTSLVTYSVHSWHKPQQDKAIRTEHCNSNPSFSQRKG